jgi:hypothetical protein
MERAKRYLALRYFISGVLMGLFIFLNIQSILFAVFRLKYLRFLIHNSLFDSLLFVVVTGTITVIYNRKYMESLYFTEREVKNNAVILTVYSFVSITLFILVKLFIKGLVEF